MKQIRRSLKNDRHQSPPSSGGSHQSGGSMAYQQGSSSGGHHVLGNGGGLGGGQSSGVTLPPVRTQGKTPPTKVIRAINSYRSMGPPELTFEAGDFFHVMGDGQPRQKGGNSNISSSNNASEELWYDAHNPLTRARGIVPESYFQVLGRNERDNKTGSSLSPPPMQLQSHNQQQPQQQQQTSSVASSSKLAPAQTNGISPTPSPSSANFPQNRGSNSSGQPKPRTVKPSPLYGVVQYDFIAERADELDARKGEPIIVIAQSNHEWFVAKPIGRLGGPGLIPVSFVAISDSTTGEPLPQEKVQEMIASGMVPPVDEWKKATAEYKQASIPLGRFEFSNQNTPVVGSAFAPQQQSQPQQFASTSSTSLPYGRQSASANASSASLGQQGLGRPPSGHSASNTNRFTPNTSTSSLHKPQQSSFDAQLQSQARSSGQDNNSRSLPSSNSGQLQSYANINTGQQPSNDHISPTDEYFGNVQQGEQGSVDEMYDRYGLVTHATVESFHSEEENYWFHLRVHFGQSSYSLILYRLYDDFLEFQMALMDEHPIEAGKELPPDARPDAQPQRIIPKMPGPVEHVDEVVCAQRVDDLTVYLKGLCALPDYLRMHALFYEFFMPRAGDVEVATPDEQARARWESIKAKQRAAQDARGLDEEVVEYLDQMGSVTDAMGRANIGGSNGQQPRLNGKASHSALPQLNTSPTYNTGYSMPSASSSQQHARQDSGSVPPPSAGGYMSRLSDHSAPPQSAGSGVQFTSPWASSSGGGSSQPSAAAPPPFVKIKIFHRNTDDLIAIRVPPSIKLDALLDKVRERLGGDVSHVRYRDEGERPVSQSQAASALTLPGGARLVELRDDIELDSWIKGTQRLVAYVD